ncbi:hypothetical protein CC79DRAFT_1353432 [Sarocladium strictum]
MSATESNAMKSPFIGTKLQDLPTPCGVLDLAKVEVNCQRMLNAVRRLQLGWRPHIKTHKTWELTRLQVGDAKDEPVRLCVSTVLEVENLVPLAQEYQSQGRSFNVLYAFPVYPSVVDRLAKVSTTLGPDTLSLMIDHPSQLSCCDAILEKSGNKPIVFMKVDMGYRRAGVIPSTTDCEDLIEALLAHHAAGKLIFHGIYAHAGHSYEAREDWKALDYLNAEFKALEVISTSIEKKAPGHNLTLSVGASPTTTSLQHPGIEKASESTTAVGVTSTYLRNLKQRGYHLEVHAGVYPVLDLQQLATHARDSNLLSAESIAISILVEVASLYPGRGPNGTTEALINAGCLALGREPCADLGDVKGQHYNGWGIVAPWGIDNPVPDEKFPAVHGGWQIGKVSQEHGVLRWRNEPDQMIPLEFGQKIRIWPNHACVAGAGFDKYFIIDSRRQGHEDDVVDVWQRWNGW